MIFTSDRGGAVAGAGGYVFIKGSMDPGRDESLLVDIGDSGSYDWSRDGKWISYGGRDIWIASASGDLKPFPFLATSFREGGGRFSPDGKWIAYTSDETGRVEVYVRRFSGGAAGAEGKVQISRDGGEHPVWRSDGQELFYASRSGNDVDMYAARTSDLNRSGSVPVPVLLFRACPDTEMARLLGGNGNPWNYAFDTVDGEHFVVNCATQPQNRFSVLLNWAMPPS
jgi:Tol biopolymer transport system component